MDHKVDLKMAYKIAECESSFRNICNYNGCIYGMSIYQFVATTWQEYNEELGLQWDAMNINHNIQIAMYVMSKYGVRDWIQSAKCHNYY